MDYLLAWPFYFWSGLTGIYHLLPLVPWPSLSDIFKGIIGSFISFMVLWWPRYKLDRMARAKYLHDHKRKPAPTSSEHQQAAAAVSSLFDH